MKVCSSLSKLWAFSLFIMLAPFVLRAQVAPVTGIENENSLVYAFTGAILHVSPDETITDGILLVQEQRIIDLGDDIDVPEGAVVVDLEGKHIYPSFIDAYSDFGMPAVPKTSVSGPQPEGKRTGPYYWNQAIQPDIDYSQQFTYNIEKAEELRRSGFAIVNSHVPDGIIRGRSALFFLHDEKPENLYRSNVSLTFSLNKGSSTQDYPSSQTGAIALIRQFILDADWYARAEGDVPEDLGLASYLQYQELPMIFETADQNEIFRAAAIAEEFGLDFIYKTRGDEYQQLEALKELDATYIVPLVFPLAYKFTDVYDADLVSLRDLRHWELAPYNPAWLDSMGIDFVLSSSGTKNRSEFWGNLRKALRCGLDTTQALKALTIFPAEMLGIEDEAGTLDPGKWANFFVTDKNIFEKGASIEEHWIKGKRFRIKDDKPVADIRGTYRLACPGYEYFNGKEMVISGTLEASGGKVKLTEQTGLPLGLELDGDFVNINFNSPWEGGYVRMSLHTAADGGLTGQIESPYGLNAYVECMLIAKDTTVAPEAAADSVWLSSGKLLYPLQPFGYDTLPEPETVLFRNATVWTNEAEGILYNTDVLVENGRIAKIGTSLKAPKNAKIIDATGKHLTCGIIDEHSHIALSHGVNESGQAISAEVRMSDVINPLDINIYRQLAGGVTTAQLLHGSANPIGGQSALIRLKWGYSAEEMKWEDAPGFIKFALGENVKQSNWGEKFTERYPQSRMGVEQLMYNAFMRALAYEQEKSESGNVRRDLELETLLEILDNKRMITCHSYVQSEINMLMKLADSLGFHINTFTHVLEGYKLGEKLREHGAGASTFSDWWAYKMEVMEAIPYNAALLYRDSVVTAINSDDAEMGRRLNQEAAKTVKYGGLTEEEAWKTVTLNPAILLGIDEEVGSIAPGKSADLVLWSDNPLSIYARVETTMIEGAIFFDQALHAQMLQRDTRDKARLINAMMKAAEYGARTTPVVIRPQFYYHCDTIGSE